MTLRPIGRVRSSVRERKSMPAWGVAASVEIFPEFEPALLKIEKHSHIWVMAWLDQGRDERDVLQVTPRGVRDLGPEGLHGVFAVRSPARPNPIGLTAARIVSIDGLTIHLDRLDFLDASPVVDLKPYFITRDLIFSANGRQVGKPVSREALRESLTVQAEAYHGALTPDVALAVRIIEHYRLEHHGLNDPASWHISAPVARPALVDALVGMTRVTLGRQSLELSPGGAVVVSHEARYAPREHGQDADGVLAAEDALLFDYTAVAGR